MKEIKFRVWDTRKNEMMYSVEKTYDWFDVLDYPHYYNLMQYTNLKDKNEKEIYEGDIISYYRCLSDKRLIAPVVFSPFGYGFVLDSSRRHVIGDIKYGDYTLLLHPTTTDMVYEVVGNVFENPELLK